MAKEKLVSIILPCYNATDYIDEAIGSLINQSYKSIEIIAIDDCSIDDTWIKLQKAANKHKNIRIFRNEKNLKLIKNLNKAIDLCKGEFIARMDSDDISDLSRIEKQMELITENENIDLVSVFPKMIDSNGNYHSGQKFFQATSTGSAKFIALFQAPILHAGILIKSSILKKERYFYSKEYQHIEDYELWIRLLYERNIELKVIPKVLYSYRINLSSVSYEHRDTQLFNQRKHSQLSIKKYYNFENSETIVKIMLNHSCQEAKLMDFNNAIKSLKKIKLSYIDKNLDLLRKEDLQEIHCWVQQRIIKICITSIINNKLLLKINAVYYLFQQLDSLLYLITYKNIFNRIIWEYRKITSKTKL